jgi:hypothetical protein
MNFPENTKQEVNKTVSINCLPASSGIFNPDALQ